jgi:hypothetical protein
LRAGREPGGGRSRYQQWMAYWPERARRAGGQAAGVIRRPLQLSRILPIYNGNID